MARDNSRTLESYLEEFKQGDHKFENAFQSVSRMILEGEDKIEKVNVNGKTTYDFNVFRQGKKPIVGMFDVINSFVSYVKDAAQGGSSREMAFVLVGEPANGKTYFVDYLSDLYRRFISEDRNRRFTFRFKNLEGLGHYGKISRAESQTLEDPMVLAMNLFDNPEENKEFLAAKGFDDKQIDMFFENYRPLGACSDYMIEDLLEHTDGDREKLLENHVEVIPVPLSETLGVLTGKYSAKDKITSSATDLVGEQSIQRIFHLKDTNNPYKFDLRRGALARVAGGGIHFSDELFKNKTDLVQVYLGVIQNREIELDGYKWPIDTLIVATSNNDEFNEFVSDKRQAPIVDRCSVCHVAHNTDYKLQDALSRYALGREMKTTLTGKDLHIDPNLLYAYDVGVVLTRLPETEKLSRVEALKLSAGEVAGEKSIKALSEVIDELNSNPDMTKRFGQSGLGQRDMGRAMQHQIEMSETNEGECMFALDAFNALERIVLDYVQDSNHRAKFLDDLKSAKSLYRERIMTEMFNAYMDEPNAVKKDVMNYVNMVIGIDASNLGPEKMWKYRDPSTNKLKAIKIDRKYINSVEERLGLKNEEAKESFRTSIRKIYVQKTAADRNYDFMDNVDLVKAVTDVKLKSDIQGAGSLVGALANRTNEENQKLYNRMIDTMMNKLGYCNTCAEKTIEYFCTQDHES